MDKRLVQGSPEWLQTRQNMFTASDAPVVMGVSPYATPYQRWSEKVGLAPPIEQTFPMKEGHRKEEIARQLLEKKLGLFLMPDVKFHPTLPWMMASLDAIDPSNTVVAEIKALGIEKHNLAVGGKVPEEYFPQVQAQIEVCQVDKAYYTSFYKHHNQEEGEIVTIEVYRDDSYIKKLIEKGKRFWDCIQEFSAPDMTEKDFIQKSDAIWIDQASRWRSVNEQIKELEKKEKLYREGLIAMCYEHNSMGAGIKVARIVRKGNVDYASIPQLQEVDLEKYRKKPIESYRITAT